MKVVFRPEALDDLRAIGDWIAADNPDRAATFVEELRTRAEGLAEMPLRYPVARRTPRGTVRKITHGRYLLFYRVLTDRVEILAVRHAARRDATLA